MTNADRNILRTLAGHYMEAAQAPVQLEKIALWKALNRCEMARPMVTIDQLPWNELLCEELVCRIEDPFWRGVENTLRQTLYKWKNFPVDMVLDPFISIPKAIQRSGYGITPRESILGAPDSTAKARHFTNQLTEMKDVEKILDEHITHDEAQTALRLEEAARLFGGLAPVRAVGCGFHLGVWDTLVKFMGADECYYALYDEPALLHAALERLTAATISGIEDANRLGLHNDSANLCHCSHIYTDELLPESGAGRGAQSRNCWAFGLAQIFTACSPAHFEEFELPYISRMAEYFGMIYYGCCDRLDDRLHLVKRIPNVRKVSCSPWSDREAFAANIGPGLVMSVKPNPAFLAAGSFDEALVRRDLEYTCQLAKQNGVNLEFLLKDISTVKNDPGRLVRWAAIAMETVERYER